MSPNPETAKIGEKLLFLQDFRVFGSNLPEEQLFTKLSITKPRIAVNHLRDDSQTVRAKSQR